MSASNDSTTTASPPDAATDTRATTARPEADTGFEPGCGCGCGQQLGGPDTMPQVSFSTFVLSLASSALVQLGEVPDPDTGETSVHPLLARHTIDILSMLQHKTRECLDPDECRLIEGVLYDLRMKYVLKTK